MKKSSKLAVLLIDVDKGTTLGRQATSSINAHERGEPGRRAQLTQGAGTMEKKNIRKPPGSKEEQTKVLAKVRSHVGKHHYRTQKKAPDKGPPRRGESRRRHRRKTVLRDFPKWEKGIPGRGCLGKEGSVPLRCLNNARQNGEYSARERMRRRTGMCKTRGAGPLGKAGNVTK